MTEEEIIENNIFIADFIGHYHIIDGYYRVSPLMAVKSNNLKYHKSYDWLMPVVEKIESIYDEHDGYYGVFISSNGCVIQGTMLWKSLKDSEYGGVYFSESHLKDKLSSTYNEVIKFIKWYNKNKND